MIPTLWAIATLTFFMMRLAPGGPFQSEREIPAAAKAQLERSYGLDRPLGEQYVRFLGNAARLDFGPSYKYPTQQVGDIIRASFPASFELGLWSLLLALAFGVPGLGRYLVNAAFNRDYTLVMGVVLFYAAFLMVLNLIVDVAYTWLDPRVELR